MPDFLLEIGCEEIPARMIDGAQAELAKRVRDLIARDRLAGTHCESYSTPRRLGVIVNGVASAQADTGEVLTGPGVSVAYRDGQPTTAARKFAEKAGVAVEQLSRATGPKGEYVTALVWKKGRNTTDIIQEKLPAAIAQLYWAKNMYWRVGKPERFVRPVRWIVAIFGDEVIPFDFAGVRAGKSSRGHRILGPQEVVISSPAEFAAEMEKAYVIASGPDREHRIRKALDAAARTIPGARWREDSELLKTVVNLTEWPSAILGNFDQQFLSLPEEVLVTVMRDHQKYFAVEDASSKLAPYFLAVLNTDGDPDGLIRHGNERVLRARFNDAQFFWNTDQKIPLTNRVEMLKAVTFQKDLGNYHEKARRMTTIASFLTRSLTKAGMKVDDRAAQQSVELAKTDLTAELVKEFTELQGIIGGLYAKAQGLRASVADAIYDQYKPVSMEDTVPRTLEGAVLSIADKTDSIAGMFALGLVPSGSKDPFALRRQANGIVKIIADHKLPIRVGQLMQQAREAYNGSLAEKKFTLTDAAYREALNSFFRERLEFYLRETLGLAYDVVNATLAADADDVIDAVARGAAVAKVRPSADFESISVAFKRMKNILRQAAETKKKVADPFTPETLAESEEKKLAEAIPQIAKRVRELRTSRQYDPALVEISRLRPLVDAFFDKVMVMVEDENLRANRLGLLQTLVREFSSIADFSEIVTEKK